MWLHVTSSWTAKSHKSSSGFIIVSHFFVLLSVFYSLNYYSNVITYHNSNWKSAIHSLIHEKLIVSYHSINQPSLVDAVCPNSGASLTPCLFTSAYTHLVLQKHYLPSTLQEVADIVISLRYQMKRLPNDLLLHVLCLQDNMVHIYLSDSHSVWFLNLSCR